MTPSELFGMFITGILGIAILSLIVAPTSQASKVVNAFGTNFVSVLGAAKSYPS
jgi:hypothetical protein